MRISTFACVALTATLFGQAQADKHYLRQAQEITSSSRVKDLLASLTLQQKIGQMSQLDINKLLPGPNVTLPEGDVFVQNETEYYIGELGIGSILNTATDIVWTAEDYRRAMKQIQQVAEAYGHPPVIWGLDSVHGANYVHGANLAPQPINMAATFNETVSYEAGKLASRDTRAAGINWIFSPVLGLALEPLWARNYETFGEDPYWVGRMGAEMIKGMQEPDSDPSAFPGKAASCGKHFVGYSMPRNGKDRTPSWIPVRHLYQYFLHPWEKAVEAGVMTVMEGFTEYDGVPVVSSPENLNYMLRHRLDFDGVMLTDYAEILNLADWHRIVNTTGETAVYALSHASIDMSMIPNDISSFIEPVEEGVNSGALTINRIDLSVERVLALKEDLGMFDASYELHDPNIAKVGTDREETLDMVRQSLILTKNEDGTLPLQAASALNVLVTGPTANSLTYQAGGWTWQWQGAPNDEDWFTYGTTVKQGMEAQESWTVEYECGVDVLGRDCGSTEEGDVITTNENEEVTVQKQGESSMDRAVGAAAGKDVVVVAVGEEAYTEKPGDIRTGALADGQYELVRNLRESAPDAKIVLVYIGGRPRLLKDMVELADAVIVAFLPGPDGGQAVADIATGVYNPSGRLPLTYPMFDDGGGSPYYNVVSDMCNNGTGLLPHYQYLECQVQWPFGHGLSYTEFAYSNLRASGGNGRDLELSVLVSNTGSVAGSHAVMFFTFDEARETTPEEKRLRAVQKVHLDAGEEQTVTLTVPASDLKFVGPHDDKHYIFDPSMAFWVGIGARANCRADDDTANCVKVVPEVQEDDYFPECELACSMWERSGCGDSVGLSNENCLQNCATIYGVDDNALFATDTMAWNYVSCVESVMLRFKQDNGENDCSLLTTMCRDLTQSVASEAKLSESDTADVDVGASSGSAGTNLGAISLIAGTISALLGAFFIG